MGWPDATVPRVAGFAAGTRVVVLCLGIALGSQASPPAVTGSVGPARPADPSAEGPSWQGDPDWPTRSLLSQEEATRWHREQLALGRRPLISPWYQFDAIHYIDIATRGYAIVSPAGILLSVAFLPLLPLSIRGASVLGADPYLAGLLIPNLAFVVGLAAFARVVLVMSGRHDRAWRACILLACCPTAFFFSAPYQESLSFALCALALLYWVTHRPALAACALGPASAARQSAVMFPAALALAWASDRLGGRRPGISPLLVAVAGLAGLAVFACWVRLTFGEAGLIVSAQRAWGRSAPAAGLVVSNVVGGFRQPTFDWLAGIALLLLGVVGLRRRGVLWGGLIILPILLSMSTGAILGLKRQVLASFPVFVDLEELLPGRWLFAAAVTAGCLLQLALLVRFVNGVFVG